MENEEFIVNSNDLAIILRLSPRRISQLPKEGMPKHGRAKFNLPDVIEWFLEKRSAGSGPVTESMNSQRQLLYKAQTEREELNNSVRRRELVEYDQVQHTLNALSVMFARQIDAIGARLANELVGQTEAAIIKERIDDETRQVRESVASVVKAWADTGDIGDDTEAAA